MKRSSPHFSDLHFSLPQVDVSFHDKDTLNKRDSQGAKLLERGPGQSPGVSERLVVLGGRAPDIAWFRAAAADREVWAADRGADVCRAAGITPSYALGDFDSIAAENETWLAQKGVELSRYPADKDYTDFQLCLSRLRGDLLVTGCWGGRFDHAFANIFSALPNDEWGNVRAFADETEILIPLAGRDGFSEGAALELEFRARPPVLSLLPMTSQCRGVSIRGTKWELDRATLLQGRPCAVSNVPLNDRITVEIEEGCVGVYCFF